MPSYKEPSFQERTALAAQAREKALKKLAAKPPVDQEALAKREAARLAKEAAAAEKRAARKAEIEAAKAAKAEAAAAALAAAEAAAEAAKKPELTEEEKKAARDARYAARKKRKK